MFEQNAWSRALAAFPNSIVIVSNSAGTRDDASLIAVSPVQHSRQNADVIFRPKQSRAPYGYRCSFTAERSQHALTK